MLELHQFAPHFGLPNASPFCMKVEAYLRLAGIEYKIVEVLNPGKGPYGKAPWIIDEDQIVPDSRFILEYLNKKHDHPLKGDLGAPELAIHHALARMLDESTYFVTVNERWLVSENAPITREALFAAVPGPLRKLVFSLGQRSLRRSLHGQGMGRLSRDEIVSLGKKDVDCLADILGSKPYFAGEKAGEIDASTMASIAGLIKAPISSKVTDHIATKDNLVAYHKRMMEQLFPDYAH